MSQEEQQDLGQRERVILQAVVHTYITTAEPVGSRSIVRRFELDWSPATVRNVMADLEEAGFLQQLHTSSGRVPTNQGYQYYIDYLMRVQEVTLAERARIEQEMDQRLNDADGVLKQTGHLLALVSHQAGLVEGPDEHDARVRTIELMPVSMERVALMVADSYGRVRTGVGTLEGGLGEKELGELRGFLNEHLRGVALEEMGQKVRDTAEALAAHQQYLANRARTLVETFPQQPVGRLLLEGTNQLFEQPEFRDFGKARDILSALEERDQLAALLRARLRDGQDGGLVLIGSDKEGENLSGLSVVAQPYYVKDRPAGMVGVLGPRRMPYSKVTGLVRYTAELVSRMLTRLAG